ncbi:MAG: sulfatase-like hydrolase/transferase [Planctomycetota bacterium]
MPASASRRASENILFILTDQWPHDSFGRLGLPVPTPGTDGLAASGTVFSNAFTTCPLCSPARGALLTARFPWQTGMRDNVGVGYSLQKALSPDERTWIDAAVERGYHTGYYGKWHLGPDGPVARGAHRHGGDFDRNAQVYDPATDDYSYASMAERYDKQNDALVNGIAPFYGRSSRDEEEIEPFRLVASARDFMAEWAAGERREPFFLTISFHGPHFPHYMPERFADLAERLAPDVPLPGSLRDGFSGKPEHHGRPWWPSMDTSSLDEASWRKAIAYSMAHIAFVDEAVARILGHVDELGLAGDTTVVFTADHGDMRGAHNRFDKGAYFYDEVWRIPLTVRAPGVAPAVRDEFVSLIDVGRTLFALAGAGSREGAPFVGRDLRDLIGREATSDAWPDRAYGAYDSYNGMSFAVRAIRDARYKFVWNPQAVDEFYDLEDDPHELCNRVDDPAMAAERDRLREELFAWLRDSGDDLPARAGSLPEAGTVLATGAPGP